jgi:ribosome-associated translation inhibitor RaiA
MIAGSLELQLMADVARLRADMDKGVSIVKASTDAMKRAAEDVKAAFAGMGAGLSVAALVDFTKNTIDAAAKLRDLSVQAGMTVESLSGLAAVGKATGTGADMITAASNKLSKALATSNEESKGAATALKALGLSFDAFQKLTPDQRIQQVAMAMGMFNDGAQKSAAAMLLFGKAGAEMLPFLKDLAQTGQLHAKVTAEQAEAAHNFEVALGKLKTQADAWKRQLALELLPTLEAITTELLNMKAVANDPHSPSLLGEGIKTIFETVAALGVNVVYILKQTSNEIGGIIAQVVAFMSAPNIQTGLQRAAAVRDAMLSDAKTARQQVDQTTYNILGITNSRAGAGRSSATQYQDPRLLSATVPDFHKDLTGLEGNSGADGEKQYDALIKKIKERLAAEREELTLGRQMTEEEKFETKVRADLADLMAKYPGLSKAKVEAMLAESKALDLQTLVQRNQLEQAKEIASLRQQQKNTDYAQSAQGIQDIANAYQQQLKSINDNIKSQKDDNEATQLSDQLHVSLAEAIQMVAIARLQEEQARTNEGGEAYEAIQKEIDARKELLQIVKDRSEYEKMRDLWKSIDQTAQDVFVSIFDGGSNAFKKLTEVLKSTLLKLLYEMTVQRWIVSIAASVTGNSAIGSSLTGNNLLGSLGSLGNSGGLLNNGGLIGAGYQYLTGASAGASGASLGVANGVGMMGGDSLGALIAGNGGWAGVSTAGLGALGGVTSGVSLGGIGSGIASFGVMDTGAAALSAGIGGGVAAAGGGAGLAAGAAAAIPVIGWAIAAAALLYSIFGQKAGGPKQDGRYGMIASGVAKYDRDLSPQNNAAAQQAAQGLQAQYDSIVSTFGGTGGIKYGLGFSTDPKGTSPTFLDITGSRDGQVVSNDVNLNVGRSQQELQAAIAKMGASAVLKGLQQSNIGGIIGGYLASLGEVASKSADEVTAALARLQKAGAEKQKLDETWYQLTHTAAEVQARDRQRELDALDISNQAMQVRVNALQDEIAAQQQVQAVYAQVTAAVGDMQKQINAYLDKLNATPAGMGSPETQLAAAKSQFQQQFDLAKSGNTDAMQNITQYADQLIQAQVAYSASGPQTEETIASVKAALGQLPSMLNPTDIVAKTFQDGAFLLNATLQELIAKADANSAAQIAAITQKAADQNAAAAAAAAADEAAKTAAAVTSAAAHWGGVLGSGTLSITLGGGGPMAASGQTAGGATPFGAAPGIDPSLFGSQYGYSSYGGGAADGGVFTNSIVSGTTAFMSAAGRLHVMGESTPEAVMPLVNIGGTLGVRAVGGMNDQRYFEAINSLGDRLSDMLQRLIAVAAAGHRATVDLLSDVADNTAASARKATLDAARKPT